MLCEKLRPGLNGALFVRRDPSTSSGLASKKAGVEDGKVAIKNIINGLST